MRKNRLLTLISSLTLAVAGIASVFAGIVSSNKSNETKAWDSNEVYVKGDWTDWETSPVHFDKVNDNEAQLFQYFDYDDTNTHEFKIKINNVEFSMNNYGWHSGWNNKATAIYQNNGNMNFKPNIGSSGGRVQVHFYVHCDYYFDSSIGTQRRLNVNMTQAYTLTFDSKGGSEVASIERGSEWSVAKPTNPTKEGYDFLGWCTDSECTSDLVGWPYTLNANATLYAKWIKHVDDGYYIDVFSSTDPKHIGITPMTLNGSSTTEYKGYVDLAANDQFKIVKYENNVIKNYYGWECFKSGNGSARNCGQLIQANTSEATSNIKAKHAGNYELFFDTSSDNFGLWAPNLIDVTFNVQGHGTAPSSAVVRNGNSITKPDDPEETGYTFSGWYTESACTNSWNFSTNLNYTGDTPNYTVDAENGNCTKTLYASWVIDPTEANTYAQAFLSAMDSVCNKKGGTTLSALQTAWGTMASSFGKLASVSQGLLSAAEADEESESYLEKFAASYDYIYAKYGSSLGGDYGGNFANRSITAQPSRNMLSLNNVSSSTWIIAVVAVVGVAAVGVFFIYRKRKEN